MVFRRTRDSRCVHNFKTAYGGLDADSPVKNQTREEKAENDLNWKMGRGGSRLNEEGKFIILQSGDICNTNRPVGNSYERRRSRNN